MTNLDLDTAEELQVANYGIGGHYDPHFDFSRVSAYVCQALFPWLFLLFLKRGEKDPYGKRGNRIATVLFYVSLCLYKWLLTSSLHPDVTTDQGWIHCLHWIGNGRGTVNAWCSLLVQFASGWRRWFAHKTCDLIECFNFTIFIN